MKNVCICMLAGVILLIGAINATTPEGATAGKNGDIVIADFEMDEWGQWKTTGPAFGTGPRLEGLNGTKMYLRGYFGSKCATSYAVMEGGGAIGTLTSPEFLIERKYLNLLVGGNGNKDHCVIELFVSGQSVRDATGKQNFQLEWVSWDVSKFKGQTAVIKIQDKTDVEGGRWDFLAVDHITQSNEQFGELEPFDQSLYKESYRPQIHWTSKTGWINDVNGTVYSDGKWHLMNQHVIFGEGMNASWSHAVSDDLMSWKQLDHAVDTHKHGTAWSGTSIEDFNNSAGYQVGDTKTLIAFTTQFENGVGVVKIFYSTDGGLAWEPEKKAVVENIVGTNRDPKVFWYAPEKKWVMALYLEGDDFEFLNSTDLKNWTRVHTWDDSKLNECPDMFELPVDGNGDDMKWVFVAHRHYYVGTFDGEVFTPTSALGTFDFGHSFAATQIFSQAPNGRVVQIAWAAGGRYPRMPFNQQNTFPVELSLRTRPDGVKLFREPVKEIEKLHKKEYRFDNVSLKPGDNPLNKIKAGLLEINAEFELGDAKTVGFTIKGQNIIYDVAGKYINSMGKVVPLAPMSGNKIKLHILVDNNIIEVFANEGEVSLTSCIIRGWWDHNRVLETPYPRRQLLKDDVAVFATGGTATITSMKIWELKSIW